MPSFCPSCGKEVAADATFCPSCGSRLVPGQPQAPVYSATYRGAFPDPDASAARTLTLAAIIVQGLFFFLFLFIFGFVFMIPFGAAAGFPAFGFFTVIFGIGFFIGVVWIILDYFLVYANLSNEERFPRAKTPALVLGIVQLLVGGLIPGILLIIAYVKIGDSLRTRGKALY